MGYVYGLRLVGSNECRYVGKTVNLKSRIAEHLRQARLGANLPVYRWIRKHKDNNLEFFVIEESSDETLPEREVFWISEMRASGNRLLNITNGGEGTLGYRHTEETRRAYSMARKGMNSGPSNPNYGKFGSEHPAFGRKTSDETREKLSMAKSGERNPNYGKKFSEETKAKMSAAQKGVPKPSSSRSAHIRWHENMGKKSETCKHCTIGERQ